MTGTEPIHVRRLDLADRPATLELVAGAGAHGVYVRNALATPGGDDGDDLLGFLDPEDRLQAVAWFGARGNLVFASRSGDCTELDPVECARSVFGHGSQWRIALGPAPVVAALRQRDGRTALVDRTQIYYAVDDPQVFDPELLETEVRPAQRSDIRALTRAALDLNESDLRVPAWRVHRGWLRESVRRRVREGRTWVSGPVGAPLCKLDIGSRGPAGAVLEGVHTVVEARGRGLATRLVAAVAARLLATTETVCLHVAEDNVPARRAYESAGMRQVGSCRLLLRG